MLFFKSRAQKTKIRADFEIGYTQRQMLQQEASEHWQALETGQSVYPKNKTLKWLMRALKQIETSCNEEELKKGFTLFDNWCYAYDSEGELAIVRKPKQTTNSK